MAAAALGGDPPGGAPGRRLVSFGEAADVETDNFPDMAFYHMLLDACEAKETMTFKARPIFGTESRHPLVDSLDVDRELVVKLLYGE